MLGSPYTVLWFSISLGPGCPNGHLQKMHVSRQCSCIENTEHLFHIFIRCEQSILLAGVSPESVFTNLSSKFDENLPACSQFYSDYRVNFSTPTSCQSATFGPLAFCGCPLLLRQKSSKNHKCCESVSIGVINQVLSANDDPNTLLQINR